MSWADIHENDYGFVGKLTLVQDDAAVDISSYTTRQYILIDPAGAATTKTASFDDDGTDGVLAYTFLDGDIDAPGIWKVAARIAKTGVELTSQFVPFLVLDRLDE